MQTSTRIAGAVAGVTLALGTLGVPGQPEEGLEDALAHVGRNAGAAVADLHVSHIVVARHRHGDVVAAVRAATVTRGSFTLGPVDLQLDVRDRVAVTGPNGAGKTSLLALLLGRTAPASGTAVLGPGVVVGEVDQAREAFEGDTVCVDPPTRTRTRQENADAAANAAP